MAQDKTYNGWPNRETWNVMLWLDNDEGAYRHYVARVRELQRLRGRKLDAAMAKEIAEEALGDRTGDGISLESSRIRWGAIARAMKESQE